MLHPLDQILPTRGKGFMDDLWIGEGKVGWADGINELAQQEDEPAPLLLIELFVTFRCLEQGCRGQQIVLFERIKDRVLLPIREAEAFIAVLRLDDRFTLPTQSPELEGAIG